MKEKKANVGYLGDEIRETTITERIYHLVDFTLLDKYFPGLFKPAKNSLTDSLCYNPVSAVSALFANALLEGDSG